MTTKERCLRYSRELDDCATVVSYGPFIKGLLIDSQLVGPSLTDPEECDKTLLDAVRRHLAQLQAMKFPTGESDDEFPEEDSASGCFWEIELHEDTAERQKMRRLARVIK